MYLLNEGEISLKPSNKSTILVGEVSYPIKKGKTVIKKEDLVLVNEPN